MNSLELLQQQINEQVVAQEWEQERHNINMCNKCDNCSLFESGNTCHVKQLLLNSKDIRRTIDILKEANYS